VLLEPSSAKISFKPGTAFVPRSFETGVIVAVLFAVAGLAPVVSLFAPIAGAVTAPLTAAGGFTLAVA
jgi:hypothetical protein